MSKQPSRRQIQGAGLRMSASIYKDYSKPIDALMLSMHREIMVGVNELAKTYAQDSKLPKHGNAAARVRVLINFLLKKYRPLFAAVARRVTNKMIDRVMRNSAATLNMSLKDMAAHLAIKTDYNDDRLREIAIAASAESSSMIKTIPEQYLGDVQRAVLRAVSSGKGYADLVPFFEKYYKSNKRKAQSQAMNQTRSFYANVSAARMEKLGIEEFVWEHSGGGRDPRKEHVAMSGKVYKVSIPPVIYYDKGTPVHGYPGQAAHCRCFMRPVLNFKSD